MVERALDAVLLRYVANRSVHHIANNDEERKATKKLRQVLRRLNFDAKRDLLKEFLEQDQGSAGHAGLAVKLQRVFEHRNRFAHKLASCDASGAVRFFDEITHTLETFTAEEHAQLDADALEAYNELAVLAVPPTQVKSRR